MLMKAWGVRNITLLDYGRVALSNPLRQSLFTHEDSLNNGKLKAEAAAENLKRIFPGVVVHQTLSLFCLRFHGLVVA
jgi:ubiquitin-like modifier-activating enzyme ATG7